jgi:predicted HTH transcriptional regulator
LVSADLNKGKIKAKAPSIYIQDFLDENDQLPTTLKSHLIDDLDAFGIRSDDYSVFLEKRANMMFRELKDRIDLKHKEDKKEDEVREMILSGENEKLEIKSTLRFDLREGKINKKLEYVVAKTISAFLNSEGGTLIIGVDDVGNILGLEKDMQTLSKPNKDGFELHLRQVIKKYLGEYFEKYLKISFPKIDDKEVCVMVISKSGKPVFVTFEGNESFFVRNGNASIRKNRQEQSEYEKLHWN